MAISSLTIHFLTRNPSGLNVMFCLDHLNVLDHKGSNDNIFLKVLKQERNTAKIMIKTLIFSKKKFNLSSSLLYNILFVIFIFNVKHLRLSQKNRHKKCHFSPAFPE